jgi:hypothetical protein
MMSQALSTNRIDALVDAGDSGKLRLSVAFAQPESILDRG